MAEENKAEQKTSATKDAQDKLQSSKEHARKAAEDLKSGFRKTQSNTCVKIQRRRFSQRSELGSCWV